jgi:hypothetical protein
VCVGRGVMKRKILSRIMRMRNNSDIDYYFDDDNDNFDHGFNKAAMVELYGRNCPNINRQIQY